MGFDRKRSGVKRGGALPRGKAVGPAPALADEIAARRRKRTLVAALTLGAIGVGTYAYSQRCEPSLDPNIPAPNCTSSSSGSSGAWHSSSRHSFGDGSSSRSSSSSSTTVTAQRGGFGHTGSSFSSHGSGG